MAARLPEKIPALSEKEHEVGELFVTARTSKRYPLEFVREFIQLVRGGMSLSDASRQKGIQKSTGKYWLDNEEKFLPHEELIQSSSEERLRERYKREIWKTRFKALRAADQFLKDVDKITLKDVVSLMAELREESVQSAGLTTSPAAGGVSAEYHEKHAKIQVDVANFLKKTVAETMRSDGNQNQGVPPVEQASPDGPADTLEAVIGDPPSENGANG